MRHASRFMRTIGVALVLAAAAPTSAVGMPTRHIDRHPHPFAEDASRAIELRVTLGRLLGEHAFLLMEAMRADDDERAVFQSALDENSTELSGAISGIYGDAAGGRFSDLWDQHVSLLLDYGTAARDADTEAVRAARSGLSEYMTELGRMLAELNPSLDPVQEARALQAHIDQITAFSEGDYADAYASHRMAFSHMFELGDHVALEIVRQYPERFVDGPIAFSPRSDLQLALDHLLSEHMVLAAEAMRAGVREAPEFEAASASLDENTEDLANAIAGVYGSEAGVQFRDVWREHTAAYLAFVDALGKGDEANRQKSLSRLHSYHERIAQFLAAANPMLDAAAVSNLIRRHVQALITQAEATAADDAARAVVATRDGYQGTFEVGAALADAIAQQFPDRFRDLRELPPTDRVTESGTHAISLQMMAALLLTITVWLVLTVRVRAGRSARTSARQ